MALDPTRFPGGLNVVDSTDLATRAGLSPFWHDCPLISMLVDPTLGVTAGDDFTAVQATGFPYELIGTNGTFTAVASSPYGEALLSAPVGADNNEAHIAYNNDVAGCITCNATKAWWFEARVKLSQIAAEGGVMVGLLEQAASADAIIADDTMIPTATLDWIGFTFVEAVANAAPYWQTSMQLAALATVSATAALASTSYVKLGMKSIPNAAATAASVYFYVNGTRLVDSTTTAATNFPLDVCLIPHFGIKTGKNAAFTMTIDWWRAAQLR